MKTSRRFFLLGSALTAVFAAQNGLAGSRIRFGHALTSLTVLGSTGGSDYQFPPLLADRTVYRTTLVNQDDDFIDLQQEVAHPGSPTATSWVVSGLDSQRFQSLGNGKISLTASARAALTKPATLIVAVRGFNSYGASMDSAVLTVQIPADANCRFVSSSAGLDTNNGLTPNTCWAHVPQANYWTGTSITLGAGIVLFLKAEMHRTSISKPTGSGNSHGFDGTADAVPHGGVEGNPFVYSGTGWGGRAVLAGDDLIPTWSSVTQSEVGGNTNYLSIKQCNLALTSTGPASFTSALIQPIYDDDTLLYPAQWPQPTDLRDNEDVNNVGTQVSPKPGGLWFVPVGTGLARCVSISAKVVTITDDRIAARYGNNGLTGVPPMIKVWQPGNNVSYGIVTAYDYASSTITATVPLSGPLGTNGSTTAYALIGHPLDINVAGQYALSNDGTTVGNTVYAWLPSDGVKSIARRVTGTSQGYISSTQTGPNWVVWSGLTFQRYTGPAFSQGRSSGFTRGVFMTDIHIRQIWNQGEGASCLAVGGTATCNDAIVERIFFEENPRAEGIVGGAAINGMQGTPTAEQVQLYPYGKIRWNYVPQYGLGRSVFQLNNSVGMHLYKSIIREVNTVHGDGIPLYEKCFYNVVECNFFDNCSRPYTTSITASGYALVPRYNTIIGNVFLARDAYGMNMFSGEPKGTIARNILMQGPAGASYTGYGILIQKGLGVTMRNNVTSGIGWSTPFTASNVDASIYNIHDNLLTIANAPVDAEPNQIQINNSISLTAPWHVWDYYNMGNTGPYNKGLTDEMIAILGPGDIGTFWRI